MEFTKVLSPIIYDENNETLNVSYNNGNSVISDLNLNILNAI
jgi:hypothetical protein